MKKHILLNGIELHIDTDKHFKSAGIVFNFEHNEEKTGVAHFTEHALFYANKNYNLNDTKEIENLGAEINAMTTAFETKFFSSFASEDLEFLLHSFYKVLVNFKIDENLMKIEKKVILNEILSTEEDDGTICQRYIFPNLYKNSPLLKDILGSEKDVKKITDIDIEQHYIRYYNPKNLKIYISSDLNSNYVFNKVVEIFGKWESENYYKIIHEEEFNNGGFKNLYSNDKTSSILIYFKGPHIEKDLRNILALYILSDFLGKRESSLLYNEVRIKRGLCYRINTELQIENNVPYLVLNAEFNNNNFKNIMTVLGDILKNLLQNGISKEEFAIAKQSVYKKMKMEYDTPLERAIDMSTFCDKVPDLMDEKYVETLLLSLNKSYFEEIIKETINKNNLSLFVEGKVKKRNINSEFNVFTEKLIL